MTTKTPLIGSELIDCARANAKFGLQVAAERCGYEGKVDEFRQELQRACHQMKLKIDTLAELLLTEISQPTKAISPTSMNQL